MHFLPALLFASCVAASTLKQRSAADTLASILQKRKICKLVPAPATCENSCGPGYITCVTETNCYNPGLGESCCSNGKYCPAGTYCTDGGCCPDGYSLADCSATTSLSVIAPPTAESTSPAAAGSSAYPTDAVTTSAPPVDYYTTSEAVPYPTTTAAYPSYPAVNVTVGSNATGSGGLVPPPQVTVNAGTTLSRFVGLGGFSLGLLVWFL